MASVIEITDESFEATILKGAKVAMVDFAASWCPPCKILEPIVKEVAAAVGDKAVIAHLDIDESRATANKFGVLSVPTMIFFKAGKEQARLVGVNQKQTILAKINELAG
jgi:thioredoxin 1